MKDEITLKIKMALIKTLNLNSMTIIEEHFKLKDDLGLDSMSSLTFLLTLEDSIPGFTVDPDTLEMQDLTTLKSITDYVLKIVEIGGEELYV